MTCINFRNLARRLSCYPQAMASPKDFGLLGNLMEVRRLFRFYEERPRFLAMSGSTTYSSEMLLIWIFLQRESISLGAKVAEFHGGFGRSSQSPPSDISTADDSTMRSSSRAGTITPPTTLNSPTSSDTSNKPSPGANHSHQSEWSDDRARKDSVESHNFFTTDSLDKFGKPRLRYL